MHVVVLSCGDLGAEVASRLAELRGVDRVTLMTAPYRTRNPPRTVAAKLRHVYRMAGLPGLLDVLTAKTLGRFRRPPAAEPGPAAAAAPTLPPGVAHLRVADFHSPDALAALRELAPDLGVVAGTYILQPAVFDLPRLGSINLHSGKVPGYRGAAPAFWELHNGEREVGITIHRVTAALDAGRILVEATFPLDPCPAGDPLAYVERYRREVLRPNGVRLLVETVGRIADGTVEERPQPTEGARTWRSPDYAAIRELRRRVRARRQAAPSRAPTGASA